jgi:hypothetical protein
MELGCPDRFEWARSTNGKPEGDVGFRHHRVNRLRKSVAAEPISDTKSV